jgi:ankyrin repeat protein
VIEEHRDIAKEHLRLHKDLAAERLSDKERECHQLFRLTSDSKDATYEWYKNRVEERAENTCLWVLKHDHFQKWMNQESGPLLVTADPGCGKSVLAKYLIDHELPQSAAICYFFFKDQDQNTSRQALCALLHQLFTQKPALIKHAMPLFNKDGQALSKSTASLWEILRDATKDPEAGPVIIVLDALDECAESEFEDLVRNIKGQFCHGHLNSKLKYLLTCRPYEQITAQFHSLISSFPDIRIPGEEESEAISQEIRYVITHRVNQLSALKNLTVDVKDHLTKRLQEITHRTYLWVYLIFKHLEEISFKKTRRGIELIIATLPSSINEAYERILDKSKEREAVQKALSIVLAANRPLNLGEMNAAMNLVKTSHDTYDLDLEDTESFRSRIRSLCGLFIAIHHDKVYFLHQTAREFLLTETTSPAVHLPPLSWQRSISLRQAHTTLAELCVTYLDLFNSHDEFSKDIYEIRVNKSNLLVFLDYAAENWHEHVRKGNVDGNVTILPHTMQICDPSSKSRQLWFPIFLRSAPWIELAENATELVFASYFGLTAVAKLCLERGSDIETADEYSWTPLFWAASEGHEEVVKVLLEKGADIDATDTDGETPLWQAASNGHEEIVKMLLEKGANIEATDKRGSTLLCQAASNGREEIIKVLLEKGANIEATEKHGNAPLFWAALRGHEEVVKVLLEKGADIKATDKYGTTPLFWAASNGREEIIKVLLEKGANIEATDTNGKTPLFEAASQGHEEVVQMLLEKGANIEATDKYGKTPLFEAASQGHEEVVKMLLEEGADIEVANIDGETPLWQAASHGHEEVVKMLLEEGADIEVANIDGETPLWQAAVWGYEEVVKVLLEKGANAEATNDEGRTPLQVAASKGYRGIVGMLREREAELMQSANIASSLKLGSR